MDRSLDAISEADLSLVVLDGSRPLDANDDNVMVRTMALPHIVVINKCDLPAAFAANMAEKVTVHVSATAGTGMDDLREAIRSFLLERKSALTDDFVLTSMRQKEAIISAIG